MVIFLAEVIHHMNFQSMPNSIGETGQRVPLVDIFKPIPGATHTRLSKTGLLAETRKGLHKKAVNEKGILR